MPVCSWIVLRRGGRFCMMSRIGDMLSPVEPLSLPATGSARAACVLRAEMEKRRNYSPLVFHVVILG